MPRVSGTFDRLKSATPSYEIPHRQTIFQLRLCLPAGISTTCMHFLRTKLSASRPLMWWLEANHHARNMHACNMHARITS
jgi:hypothetical protein